MGIRTMSGANMYKYKIIDLREPYLSQVDTDLNAAGGEGWELVHIYNNNGFFISNGLGNFVSGSLNAAFDAFGRSRVSQPFTLNDYKHIYGDVKNLFIDNITADGSIVDYPNSASVVLSAISSGSSAVHQTKMYHHYMPGKSQTILASFRFGAAVSGSTKRTGYFDDYNGIFLEQDATGSLQFVIRSAVGGTGSLAENRVKQDDWNVHTLLDGSIVLDITKAQLFYIDFQWLSIGRVRCGFVIKGMPIVCHVFDHANVVTEAYMQSPNLPVRCEIRNSVAATSSMEQICSSVMSEGGYVEAGKAFSVASDTFRTLAGGATLPVIAIRLKNSINGLPNRAFVRLQNASTFTDQQTVRYSLLKLPSGSALTTSSAWISVDQNSVVEWNSGSAYLDGVTLLTGFVGANSLNPTQATPEAVIQAGVANRQNFIAQNYDSTDSEIYVVVAKNMTNSTTNVGGAMLWSEIY